MFKLNSFYGRETTNLEFKEFCLKYNKNELLTKDLIIDMIENNYIHESIQFLIKYNLKEYIKYLIPKYTTCFGNASLNGKIILGVNDYGEITGIPIHKTMNIKHIEQNLKNIIKNTIKKNLKCNTPDLEKYITIDFKKITIDINILSNDDEINEIYEHYCDRVIKNNNIIQKFYEEKALWLIELNQYCTKLVTIINTRKTRNELIDYIVKYNKNKKNKEYLISILKTNKIINVPMGIDIALIKEDNTSMIYWLTEYKDAMMKMMLDKKPQKPTNILEINFYSKFLRLTTLTKRLINADYDFYILNINFNLKDLNDEFIYKSYKNHKWIHRCRTIINGNPCCY
jgi:hypothetical protein